MIGYLIFFEWITGLIMILQSTSIELYFLGITNFGLCLALNLIDRKWL